MTPQTIALHRFGLGATPEDRAPDDPRGWVTAQFARFDPRPAPIAATRTALQAAADLVAFQQQRREVRAAAPAATSAGATPMAPPPKPGDDPELKAQRRALRQDHYAATADARLAAALASDTPFVERMVFFWANHFAVSADKQTVTPLAGAFEFEAIRPHVLGRFGDMLSAVARHPAMLLYLDQAISVGPDSLRAQRAAMQGRRRGLNENLAREILELHTLGVGSGYTQGDVTEFARALTGWTVAGLGGGGNADLPPGTFLFVPGLHEPGARTLLGRRYADDGLAQGQAILNDLAAHRATARHVATKLTRHLAGDQPPAAMVDRVAAAFLSSGGDLPTVYRALVASPEAWAPGPVKFLTPWEWTVAAGRATGQRRVPPGSTLGLLDQLGQPMWRPGQPNGFDDLAATWAGPDAVMRRVEAAQRIAARTPPVDARRLADQLHPGALSAATAQAIARADSPAQALALLLVAPETLRR
ncbi:DUF1800 domain-containing protein [uncultured Sphingomonas sp.]|uniref:DUF1800 domain-containing protein n=1 Tax=uncultured Sphingomonas sp. TaxID=158754 RepID=UPI0025860FE4|nr:DUF1800 domain-containing protein [uncultured Sphingomonas sp.]